MKIILAIGSGSFIGGALRYLLSQFVQARYPAAFPYGTFGVNIIGCLLIGVVFAVAERNNLPQEWRLFLATGVLGGFTTFSSFSYETVILLRDGQHFPAAAYIFASIVVGLLATFIGIALVKLF